MSQWVEVRHLHLVEGVPKKEIARRLKLDVKTVRRAIGQPPPPVRVSPPRPSALTPWREQIKLELQRAQPGCPLPNSRLRPAQAIGQVDQALAAMLPVERRGQAYGRVSALSPTTRHRPLHAPSRPPTMAGRG